MPVPFALGHLLRDGPTPLAPRPAGDPLKVVLVLGPGRATSGLPPELLTALGGAGVALTTLTEAALDELLDRPPTPDVAVSDGGALRVSARGAEPAPLADVDVVLAAGWPAAPAVLTLPGVRARAVLLTNDPAPLDHLGWTADVPTLAPTSLGGALPAGADAAYVPMAVHRREELVLVHGEEPFGLLAAAELHLRRPELSFAVSGVRDDLELPFPFLGVEPGAESLAHAFASAAVALAPPVRGWRPAAVAMLACGQPTVVPDDAAARATLAPDAAVLAPDPIAAARAAERLIDDWGERAERVRAGLDAITPGWAATARALADALRDL